MKTMKSPRGGGNANIGGIEYSPDEFGLTDVQDIHVEIMESHNYVLIPDKEAEVIRSMSVEDAADRQTEQDAKDAGDDEDPIVTTFENMSRTDLAAFAERNKLKLPANVKAGELRKLCIAFARKQQAQAQEKPMARTSRRK